MFVAFYSPSKHVSKLIRFSPTFVQQRNDKFGRILPSAVYFEKGQLASVGKSALLMTNNIQNGHGEDQSEGYLLTSVKRIWGMDKVQIQDVMTQDESFMTSCPFQTMWVDDELQIIVDNTNKKNDQSSTIPPIQVAEILLRTIRDQAKEYLIRERRRKKHYPLGLEQQFNIQGINDSTDYNIINCVITIPAHFSRNQRDKMIQAARNAGFEGHVSTLGKLSLMAVFNTF
jgi:molecular chaperone DnaK (HSP70)